MSRYLDVHHIRFREEGGPNELKNLILLCDAHHHRVHHGMLIIEGDVETGLRFLHADGTSYGGVDVSPDEASAFRNAFDVLVQWGFGQSQTKNAIAKVRPELGSGATADAIIKKALAVLQPKAW
jgi:hypothetical protein